MTEKPTTNKPKLIQGQPPSWWHPLPKAGTQTYVCTSEAADVRAMRVVHGRQVSRSRVLQEGQTITIGTRGPLLPRKHFRPVGQSHEDYNAERQAQLDARQEEILLAEQNKEHFPPPQPQVDPDIPPPVHVADASLAKQPDAIGEVEGLDDARQPVGPDDFEVPEGEGDFDDDFGDADTDFENETAPDEEEVDDDEL
jgi:hypothetical protein